MKINIKRSVIAKPISDGSKADLFGAPLKRAIKGRSRFVPVPIEKQRSKKIGLKVTLREFTVLIRLAKLHGNTVSGVIRAALRDYIKAHDARDLHSADIDKDQLDMFNQ